MRKVLLRSDSSSEDTHTLLPETNTVAEASLKNIPSDHTIIVSRSIIVVDDSPTVRQIIETYLRREGFTVHTFPDGVEMMRWLTGPEGRVPDLVILDICLPKIDGYEVARRLKAKAQFTQSIIVMLTRRDGVIDKLKGRLAGAAAYLVKPFKMEDIVSVVKTQLGISLSNDQQHVLVRGNISM